MTVVLISALVLGGSAQPWHYGDTILNAIGIAGLAMLLPAFFSSQWSGAIRFSLVCIVLLFAIPIVQLIPLPAAITAMFPGRDVIRQLHQLVPGSAGLAPISLSSAHTLQSVLYMFAPIAVFIGVAMSDYPQRRKLTLVLIGFVFASVVLGVVQLAGGEDSPLRPYTITNRSSAVGLFANANHFGAFLYTCIPLAFAWAVQVKGPEQPRRSRRRAHNAIDPVRIAALLLVASVIVVAVLGAALSRSRAAIAFSGMAIIVSLINVYTSQSAGERGQKVKVLIWITAGAVMIAAFYALDQIFARFQQADLYESRRSMALMAWQAMKDFFPVGTGAGTGETIYKMYETPATISREIINHAHNDYFEWLLEGGILSAVLMACAAAWLILAIYRSWIVRYDSIPAIDRALIRGSIIGPVFLLLHSAVDYPLRTGGLLTLFAFTCAMTIPPIAGRGDFSEEQPI